MFHLSFDFKPHQSDHFNLIFIMLNGWFHSFGLSNGANPLDSSIYHNLLEAARRDKPVSVKKAPTSAEIIETIIEKFAGPSANLKDKHVACFCSLGFAGSFRYNELSNIAPLHLESFPDYLRVLVPGLKMTFIAKVIMFILRG